ncbi:TetR/AcrR family transcriptional regulator [Streptomyces sp. 6N106]|uniref:TetR/AcrR family transcriptional regulator n=1 Tax=Streptomyces sp. 6N106 TaxID=3457418 RepID=UPI003FD1768C
MARAIELFAVQGVGASLRAIGDSIGVSHAALRYYFATRDDLLLEVYRAHEAGGDAKPTPEEVSAVAVMEQSAEQNRAIPGLVELYATLTTDALQAQAHPRTREFVQARFARLRADLAERIRVGRRAGAIAVDCDKAPLPPGRSAQGRRPDSGCRTATRDGHGSTRLSPAVPGRGQPPERSPAPGGHWQPPSALAPTSASPPPPPCPDCSPGRSSWAACGASSRHSGSSWPSGCCPARSPPRPQSSSAPPHSAPRWAVPREDWASRQSARRTSSSSRARSGSSPSSDSPSWTSRPARPARSRMWSREETT